MKRICSLITGATKNKVDDIWQKMWEGGITNPLEVISQLTYLMFIRSLDEKEFEAERMEALLGVDQKHIFPKTYKNAAGVEIDGQELRWSHFKDKSAESMFHTVSEFVFPFIKELGDGSAFSKSMETATFGISAPKTLQKAVDGIEELFENLGENIGDLGDLYEYMLDSSNYMEYGVESSLNFPEFMFPFLSSDFKKRIKATSVFLGTMILM